MAVLPAPRRRIAAWSVATALLACTSVVVAQAPPPASSASSAPEPSAPPSPASSAAPSASALEPTVPPEPRAAATSSAAATRAPAPRGSASASPHGATEARGAAVRIHDRKVFELFVRRAGQSPEARAAEATKVLERLVEDSEAVDIAVQQQGDVAVIYGGKTPILQLSQEDAVAAGDASLAIHAEGIAAKMRAAVRAERQRSAIATTVFAFSLLVFSALMAFLLVRKVGELLERLRAWLDENPQKLPALRVQGIEVVQPAAVRGSIAVALSAATLVARIGILYAWVLIALSLFDATRGYSEKLTGFVLTPVSALMGRVATGLPFLVIAAVTVLAVGVSLRFVRLFFGSIARGETTVGWLPRDLAEPTSILVRAGIVLVTLVVAAPLVTGADDGTLSRAGVVALFAIGLAATPLLACAAVGIAVVFGRKLRVGDRAGVGGREGRVTALTMMEVKLEDDEGSAVHVPHLVTLWHPTRVAGSASLVWIELSVAAATDLAVALDLVRRTAATIGSRVRADVVGVDADGAHLRVAVAPQRGSDRNALWIALTGALRREGIELGARRRPERPA